MWDRRAKLLPGGYYDGDSIEAILDQGFGDTKQVKLRLLGVYAPEFDQHGGVETARFVRDWFMQYDHLEWPFIVTTARVRADTHERMTFNRYLAIVTSPDNARNLNLEIMEFVESNGYGGGVGG